MSVVEPLSEEAEEGLPEDDGLLPNEEQLELLEKILSRLVPKDRASIGEMIHSRSRWVGGIFAGYAVFWWLSVLSQSNDPPFNSIFFGPEFLTVTILAPCLVFLGSILSDFSRELGQLVPGLMSGIMFVLAVLYVAEPAIIGFLGDSMTSSQGMWFFVRLAILCTTVLVAAKLLIDAVLLGWAKRLMDAYPFMQLISEPEKGEAGEIAAEDIETEP
jgi:hypothetical protein